MTDTILPESTNSEGFVRIDRENYPEIIQAARWMDEDNGTDHFQPGVGFIVDDPNGLAVPTRWLTHLPAIEAALAGLDHERPHPADEDTLACLKREGKEPTLFESAVRCFVSGEHTPVTIMANSSRELWIANRFFNERFEGWEFDPSAGYDGPPPPDFEPGWRALSEPLSWMHECEGLKAYWGWNLADIANDLIDRAYPGLRPSTGGASA